MTQGPDIGARSVPDGPDPAALADENQRLVRRLAREREIRRRVEAIAERGLRELYDKGRQLEFLQRIAVVANQSGSVPDLLAFALAEICRFTGRTAAHAYVMAEREGSGRMWPTDIWHAGPDECRAMRRATRDLAFARGEGLPGMVWARSEPVWIEDLRLSANFPRRAEAESSGLRSAFAIPLLIDAETVAVLEFFSDEVAAKDAELLDLLGQAGRQLGRVIERDRASGRLLRDATHDSLTDLPNRLNFLGRLEHALREYKRNPDAAFCVLFIDLDKFKAVNDCLGHQAGDALLVEVGRRLRASVRDGDVVARRGEDDDGDDGRDDDGEGEDGKPMLARLGGDEFTILLRGVSGIAVGHAIADRLQDALRRPFHLSGQEMVTSASIGIAVSSPHYQSADEVLRDADLAMYRAKENGKARCEIYDPTMHDAAARRMGMEGDLRAALREGAFVLHYQPIVSLTETGRRGRPRIVGFEALVRWRVAPDRLLQPGDFLGVAEETGLIVPLGTWVLEEACAALARWRARRPGADVDMGMDMGMSVNLSARQFAQPELVENVRRILADTGIDPGALTLEIAEAAVTEDADRADRVLSALGALGARIGIDDFGTGHSCLGQLHRLPIGWLKIDRSFVSRMESGPGDLRIVKAIVDLARNLGMGAVAEGVETEAQTALLRALGCGRCQGYHHHRPMPEEAVIGLLEGEM